jgi:Uma2 family endonuclease
MDLNQVIDGCLVICPFRSPEHQRIAGHLLDLFLSVVPAGVEVLGGTAVRTPDDSVPVPDVLVTTVPADCRDPALPARYVHTVVEVVSPDSRFLDRARKPELYADADVPCYWRVEPERWRAYRGEVPVVVVRIREHGRWRVLLAPAGRIVELPVAVGPDVGGLPVTVPLALDPARLLAPRVRHGLG